MQHKVKELEHKLRIMEAELAQFREALPTEAPKEAPSALEEELLERNGRAIEVAHNLRAVSAMMTASGVSQDEAFKAVGEYFVRILTRDH